MRRVLHRFAPWTTGFRLFVIVGTSVALIGAVSAVSLKELSLSQRLSTAPDSTVVTIRSRTFTLGQLRAAHRARIASFAKARSMGNMMAQNLRSQTPALIRPGLVLSGDSGLRFHFIPVVVEPASDWAGRPADMTAFCSSAQASACLYLPPQQDIYFDKYGNFNDYDPLINESQCSSERGNPTWNNCDFQYPQAVSVHFNPATNYRVSSTASCDSSHWKYQVDYRGAIVIQNVHDYDSWFRTGDNPSCVVRVIVGS